MCHAYMLRGECDLPSVSLLFDIGKTSSLAETDSCCYLRTVWCILYCALRGLSFAAAVRSRLAASIILSRAIRSAPSISRVLSRPHLHMRRRNTVSHAKIRRSQPSTAQPLARISSYLSAQSSKDAVGSPNMRPAAVSNVCSSAIVTVPTGSRSSLRYVCSSTNT